MKDEQGAHSTKPENPKPWEELVPRNVPLVKYVLGRLSKKLPASVDRDDLFSAGCVGLLEAARRYDPSRGVPFHSYAIPRIWGAMLDELRGNDRLSADMREQVRRLRQCREEFRENGYTAPTIEDLAERMQCSPEKVSKLMALARAAQYHVSTESSALMAEEKSLYARRGARAPRGPYEETEFRDWKQHLAKCIEHLPKRERQVVLLRYNEGLYLREIGEVLEVSESRVCQIHSQALTRLRKALSEVGLSVSV